MLLDDRITFGNEDNTLLLIICHFIIDDDHKLRSTYEKYSNKISFTMNGFVKNLINSIESKDEDNFNQIIREQDSIRKFKPNETHLLLLIKEKIQTEEIL